MYSTIIAFPALLRHMTNSAARLCVWSCWQIPAAGASATDVQNVMGVLFSASTFQVSADACSCTRPVGCIILFVHKLVFMCGFDLNLVMCAGHFQLHVSHAWCAFCAFVTC